MTVHAQFNPVNRSYYTFFEVNEFGGTHPPLSALVIKVANLIETDGRVLGKNHR